MVDSREKQGESGVLCKLNFAEFNQDLTVLVDFDLLKCSCLYVARCLTKSYPSEIFVIGDSLELVIS